MGQLDQAQILNAAMEKKAKQCDRIVGEWKGKCDGLSMDLDVAQKETRNVSSELFRVKNAYDESVLQLEEVRRENKVLSNEIKDIMDQISEGGRSSTRSGSALRPRRWSSRLPSVRLRELSSRRRTRC